MQAGFHPTAANHPMIKANNTYFKIKLQASNTTSFRGFFRDLASHNPDAMRAICHLILIDYICFPEYKLPPPCKFLEDKLKEGTALLMS